MYHMGILEVEGCAVQDKWGKSIVKVVQAWLAGKVNMCWLDCQQYVEQFWDYS